MIAGNACLQAWKPGHHISRPIPAFKLNIAAPPRQKNPAMRRNRRACKGRIFSVSLGVRDLDMGLVEEVRSQWAFYRDRRPDMYGPLTEA